MLEATCFAARIEAERASIDAQLHASHVVVVVTPVAVVVVVVIVVVDVGIAEVQGSAGSSAKVSRRGETQSDD